MSLADLLREVGRGAYDWRLRGEAGRLQRPYLAVREAGGELESVIPAHYIVHTSRGIGGLPAGLWIAILDPDVTETAQSGLYVVFLYSLDRSTVSLSLNQGVTAASERAAATGRQAKDLLRSEAAAIRRALGESASDLDQEIRLGKHDLLAKYEAGNIAAITWQVDSSDLTTWIDRFLGLYSEAVAAREDQLIRGGDPDALPPRNPRRPPRQPEVEFRPKSSADYIAHISAQEQVRTRAHERLIDRVGRYLVNRGYRPNTRVHPIDLEAISQDGPPILIEVKYFPAGHPRVHVREAIGQLYEYRHFLRDPDQPLAAVLSENPGDAYVDLLSSLGIAVMWPNGSSWEGNKHAYALALTEPA